MIVVYILIAVLMFGMLIAVHEFGHFAAAKLLGVRVNEFAIGMGPRILHKKKGETEYTWRLFPIGGFCAMEGEEEDSKDPRAFNNKPAWKKLIILAAGAFMNFLVGVLIFLGLLAGSAEPSYQTDIFVTPVIASFMDGFPAQGENGLLPGDRILEVDGHAIFVQTDIRLFFDRGGDFLDLVVERDGKKVVLNNLYMPVQNYVFQGETAPRRGLVFTAKEPTVLERLQLTWYHSIDTVRLVWISLGDLLSGAVGVRDMSGPIGIVDMIQDTATETAARYGVAAAARGIFYFVAFIAINLAVMNLLPIPALDGGQILFLAVDKVYSLFSRKHIDQKYLGYINGAGFLLLIGLMIVVAFSDVLKLFGR